MYYEKNNKADFLFSIFLFRQEYYFLYLMPLFKIGACSLGQLSFNGVIVPCRNGSAGRPCTIYPFAYLPHYLGFSLQFRNCLLL